MSKYSMETKIKEVNDMLKLVMSLGAIAKSLPIANTVIQRWFARYKGKVGRMQLNLLENN